MPGIVWKCPGIEMGLTPWLDSAHWRHYGKCKEREESASLDCLPLFGEPRGPQGGRARRCLVSDKNCVNKVPRSGAGRTKGFGNRKAHSHGGDGEGLWIPRVTHCAVQEEPGRRRLWEGKTVDRGVHEGGPLTGLRLGMGRRWWVVRGQSVNSLQVCGVLGCCAWPGCQSPGVLPPACVSCTWGSIVHQSWLCLLPSLCGHSFFST